MCEHNAEGANTGLVYSDAARVQVVGVDWEGKNGQRGGSKARS